MDQRQNLPDPAICITRRLSDSQEFHWCLVKQTNPAYCQHSTSFGSAFLCRHPNREEFDRPTSEQS